MKAPRNAFATALVLATAGCVTPAPPKVSQASIEESVRQGICCVHKVPMKKESVPALFGFVVNVNSDASQQARESLFPFDRRPVYGGHTIPTTESQLTAVIYVCPRCEEAKALWISSHPSDPWAKTEREKAKPTNN